MDENSIVILGILGNDKNIIPYRKELNKITGGVIPTILLQQFLYWWNNMEQKAFYKFITPCEHKEYKAGDSWCEELGITKYQFKSAYKTLEELKIVSKKINAQRVTFYSVNTDILAKLIKSTYLSGENQLSMLKKPTYLSGENQLTSITENTTETTQREEPSEDSLFPFFVEEFGEDEKSNTIDAPSMNQVKAKAKALDLSEEIAESFWLKQEQMHWKKMLDWVPALRRFGMSWKRNEEKYRVKEKNEVKEVKKPTELKKPRTIEELKEYFFLIGEDELKKRTLKISKDGEVVMPYWTGKQFCTLDGYALEQETSEKLFNIYLKNFDEIEGRVA